jgi:hypothetical protein
VALLPTQVINQAGTVVAFSAAAAGGDTCATGSDVKLLVKNDSASAVTVTITTPGAVDGDLAIADRAVTVGAGAIKAVPVTDRYRDPETGVASISYAPSVTSVSVAVIR